MAKIVFEGNEVEVAEDWRIGELIRAEDALGIDMETARTAGKTALVLYISMARVEPWQPGSPGNRSLADTVMRMEITGLFGEGEGEGGADDPPAEEPDPGSGESGTGSDNGEPLTSGLRRSA